MEPAAGFEPLMTLYLTDSTPPEQVQRAVDSGIIKAFKLYPAGATTNSASGVANADIMAYGSFSGEVDTHFTVEITGANEFRWKRGPRDRVHGTTPGCPTTSTSAEC